MQDRTDLQHGRRVSPPVAPELHLRRAPLSISNREPGEHPTGLLHLNGEARRPVGRSHRIDGLGEGHRVSDVREQVDVIRQPFQEPMRLDGVPAGQDEAVSRGGSKTDTGESGVKGIHAGGYYAALRASCGNRPSHINRTRGGSHSLRHTAESSTGSRNFRSSPACMASRMTVS